jgi:hypothetical protein
MIERCMKVKSSIWLEVAELGVKAAPLKMRLVGIP